MPGFPRSDAAADREGPVVQIQGHVNLNTASRDACGRLPWDPHDGPENGRENLGKPQHFHEFMAPPVKPYKMTAAEINTEATASPTPSS